MKLNLFVLLLGIATLAGCKKSPEDLFSSYEGVTWTVENPEKVYVGAPYYGSIFYGNGSSEPIYWQINSVTFYSGTEDYNNYGKAEVNVTLYQGTNQEDFVDKVEYWIWNDTYKSGGKDNLEDIIGLIICTKYNKFNFQVVSISKKKMECIFNYVEDYGNSGAKADNYYSGKLSFKRN